MPKKTKKDQKTFIVPILILLAINLFVVFPIVREFARHKAHKDAYMLYQQEKKHKNNLMNTHAQKIHAKIGDKTINMNVNISETENSIRYNMNGETLDMDKEVVLGKECQQAHSIISDKIQSADSNTMTNMFVAILLYSYKNFFVSYCADIDMKDYSKQFDLTFKKEYNNAVQYLNNLTENKAEKCIIIPNAKAKKEYFYHEIEILFNETKSAMGELWDHKISLTKSGFCTTVNEDKETQDILFEEYRKSMQEAKKIAPSINIQFK